MNVNSFSSVIDADLAEAFVGGWVYTDSSGVEVTLGLRFIDTFGFDISSWEQNEIKHVGIWKEVKYRVKIPKVTRTIAFTIYSNNNNNN